MPRGMYDRSKARPRTYHPAKDRGRGDDLPPSDNNATTLVYALRDAGRSDLDFLARRREELAGELAVVEMAQVLLAAKFGVHPHTSRPTRVTSDGIPTPVALPAPAAESIEDETDGEDDEEPPGEILRSRRERVARYLSSRKGAARRADVMKECQISGRSVAGVLAHPWFRLDSTDNGTNVIVYLTPQANQDLFG